MADSMPFNSIAHDRVYKAEDWMWFFAMFLANGVFPRPSDGLQVIAYNKMEIRVKFGYAFINGSGFRNPTIKSITLDTAEGALNRIDRIVVRWDQVVRDTYLAVLKGVPSARPAAVALTRNTEIWELAIADVYVGKGVTKIQTKDITDQRFNSDLCGIVKGTVEEIDASVLTKQFNDFFNAYSKSVLEKYEIYIRDIQEYLDDLESSGNSRMDELIEKGQEKYDGFDADITRYIKDLKTKGDTDITALTQQLLDFKNENQAAFLEWFENIKDMLNETPAGNLQLQIGDLFSRLNEISGMLYTGMMLADLETDDGDLVTDDAGNIIIVDWPICGCQKANRL